MSNIITCPNCSFQFSLSDVQKHELDSMREKMKLEVEAEMKKRAFAWAQEEVKKTKLEADEQAKKIRQEVEELNRKQLVELESLRKRDEESRKKEMDFLRQQNEFETLKKNLELEKDRARMEERKKLEEEFTKQAQEKVKLELEKERLDSEKKLRAKDEQIEQMKRSIEDAKRKGDQGSMQIQGEILENSLKDILMAQFPTDVIEDVEKGIKGADLVERVRDELGQTVGVIAWESKNTKAWSDGWVSKLKEDRLRVNASISVLVSAVMPKGIERFGLYEGVWIVDWVYVREIATILRNQLIEISHLENSLEGREERLEVVFRYLTSSKFRDKMENIIDAFRMLQDQVTEERRAFESRWKKREELLDRVLKNTSGMYGELSGILGAKLQKVEYLELGEGG